MIIHCSQKLAAKLRDVSREPLEETSPLGSWHGHLFVMDRRQCVMFCHDATRFVLFLPGLRKEQFDELGTRLFRYFFVTVLEMSGYSGTQLKKVELALGTIRFDTAIDRSVQGSMRIAKQDLEPWVWDAPSVLDVDPVELSCRVSHRPATVYGRFLRPDQAMRELIEAL